MSNHLIFLTVPGLRQQDLSAMPQLSTLTKRGTCATLVPSFPCVTWPVQANMLTGKLPEAHGIVANGLYWRDRHEVEMWTAWNDKILSPQIWDQLHQKSADLSSAAWFPMLSKGCGADYVCMPAPIHNPDGSESLWCYTKPVSLYGELRDELGHFPLQHFWGPLANIKSTAWIANSAASAAKRFHPNFFYIYLPHLDYAAQKTGPNSPAAIQALTDLDNEIGKLAESVAASIPGATWVVASEYVITEVDHVSYPNRILREAGLLHVRNEPDGEHLDLKASQAWALVDHQFSHVFVKDRDPAVVRRVAEIFGKTAGIRTVLDAQGQRAYGLQHERSGDLVLVSTDNSWQAYYWWLDDSKAPGFARTVDIHRKPGYDPVELHVDFATKSIPLNAGLIKGSHGAPATSPHQQGVVLCSEPDVVKGSSLRDIELHQHVARFFGMSS